MKKFISHLVFSKFNWDVLKDEEKEILKGGIEKHASIMWFALIFLPFQMMIAAIVPDLFILLSAVSFIVILLGGAWYTVSFQNISADQLDAGIANFITQRMFRAFVVSLSMLVVGMIFFLVKTLFPEVTALIPEMKEIPVLLRLVVLVGNAVWVIWVLIDIVLASIAYDGADSLLGDGFPTLMRGAKASHGSESVLKDLVRLLEAAKEKPTNPES